LTSPAVFGKVWPEFSWEKLEMPQKRARRTTRDVQHSDEKRYRILVENLPVGVYRTAVDGRFVEVNPALVRMLGFKNPAALLTTNAKDFYIKKTDRARHLERLAEKPRYFTEFELRSASGRRFWVRDYCKGIRKRDGKLVFFDGILVDITERKTAERKLEQAAAELRATNEKLESLSLTDDLTGLSNRRGFFTLGQQQLKIAKRLRKGIFLLYIDLDQLKRTNDTYGHPAGDRLLSALAGILKEVLRESDIIARIGGDEFAVLAMRAKKGGEKVLLDRVEERVRVHNLRSPKKLRLSLSLGIVGYERKKFNSLEEFLAHADYLMYQQKRRKAAAEA
jgi:diguanylate cyclase (GGDEF)-like protein/PAS domain S-box-containing protein